MFGRMASAMLRFAMLGVLFIVSDVDAMDGGDQGRRNLRSSCAVDKGKMASNADPSAEEIRIIASTGLSFPMLRRATAVSESDNHIGIHVDRVPAVGYRVPVVGDRVWARFSSTGRAIRGIMYPATISGLEFDGDRLVSVHVTWWHRWRDHTHRNLNQVFFRYEQAPGDFPEADEVFANVFDDDEEERIYQLMHGEISPCPSVATLENADQIPSVSLPTNSHGNGSNYALTVQELREELEMTHRHLAETRSALADAHASADVWMRMVEDMNGFPSVVGLFSGTVNLATTPRTRGRRPSGATAGNRRSSDTVNTVTATRIRAQRGAASAAGNRRPANPHSSISSRSLPSYHTIVNDAMEDDAMEDDDVEDDDVEDDEGGADVEIAGIRLVNPNPVRTSFGRVILPRNFYAPADDMTERPRDWYGGPSAGGSGADGAAGS